MTGKDDNDQRHRRHTWFQRRSQGRVFIFGKSLGFLLFCAGGFLFQGGGYGGTKADTHPSTVTSVLYIEEEKRGGWGGGM